jgi:glutamine amidotransferase
MIVILDYGLGNVRAIDNIYRKLNIQSIVSSDIEDIKRADKIILPGVGSYDWAMTKLLSTGWKDVLDDMILVSKIPVLGICVGMQMLGFSSEEGSMSGLGWIPGHVKRLRSTVSNHEFRLPHMGWNDVFPSHGESIFKSMVNYQFYFLHSYCFVPEDDSHILATTDYFGSFACAVHRGNVFGVQFHPEKSHQWGIDLLRKFAEI